MTLTGSLRFARYEVALWRRTWYGSAFSIFVAPILYLAGIGLGIGAMVADGNASVELGGVSYAAFAGTGLLAASSMQTGVGELAWPVMGAIRYTGTWVAASSTPLSPADIVGGTLLVLAVRLTVAAGIFGLSLLVLGLVGVTGALGVIGPGVMVGLACGTPIFAFTARTRDPIQLSYVFRFVVVPIFIVSGTFFPISQLPGAVQPLAALSPLWHGVELVRLAGLGLPTTYSPLVHLLVLITWFVAGLVATNRLLAIRLQP